MFLVMKGPLSFRYIYSLLHSTNTLPTFTPPTSTLQLPHYQVALIEILHDG